MKILMLGWELPPHNSGGLGIACYQLCQALSRQDVDIEFVLPYQADHGIDFMDITAAHPQGVAEIIRSGIAYDSYKYILEDGREEWLNIHDQQALFEEAVGKMVDTKEFDIVHAHDWLTFRAALRVKQIKNCPVILHVHSVESDRAATDTVTRLCVRSKPLACIWLTASSPSVSILKTLLSATTAYQQIR